MCFIDGFFLWHKYITLLRSEQVKWSLKISWIDAATCDQGFSLCFTWTFLMLVSPETSFHVRFICWTENVTASLFDSHVELMIRKLNFVCLVFKRIPCINNAEAKATKGCSSTTVTLPYPHTNNIFLIFCKSDLVWLSKTIHVEAKNHMRTFWYIL